MVLVYLKQCRIVSSHHSMNNEISYIASFVFLFGMSFQALTSCFKVALDAADEHNDAW